MKKEDMSRTNVEVGLNYLTEYKVSNDVSTLIFNLIKQMIFYLHSILNPKL